jgi:hypothetical protein
MSGRHIIIAQGRGYAVIVLTMAEVSALHTLAQAALSDGERALGALGGVSKHSGGKSSVEAGRRAAEVLAEARRAMGQTPSEL